jgi:hypothetical protein
MLSKTVEDKNIVFVWLNSRMKYIFNSGLIDFSVLRTQTNEYMNKVEYGIFIKPST